MFSSTQNHLLDTFRQETLRNIRNSISISKTLEDFNDQLSAKLNFFSAGKFLT